MRSLLDQKKQFGYYLKASWYFEKPYEKIIMVVLNVLGLWKLWELFLGVI